jgi:hypothetical protein
MLVLVAEYWQSQSACNGCQRDPNFSAPQSSGECPALFDFGHRTFRLHFSADFLSFQKIESPFSFSFTEVGHAENTKRWCNGGECASIARYTETRSAAIGKKQKQVDAAYLDLRLSCFLFTSPCLNE